MNDLLMELGANKSQKVESWNALPRPPLNVFMKERGTVEGKSKWHHQVFQNSFHLKR